MVCFLTYVEKARKYFVKVIKLLYCRREAVGPCRTQRPWHPPRLQVEPRLDPLHPGQGEEVRVQAEKRVFVHLPNKGGAAVSQTDSYLFKGKEYLYAKSRKVVAALGHPLALFESLAKRRETPAASASGWRSSPKP